MMMRKALFASTLLLAPYAFTAMATAQTTVMVPAGEAGARTLRVGPNTRQQRITLPVNKAEVIELDRDVKDVDIAGPEIVDAVIRSPRRVLLIALKAGQTNVFFTDANGQRLLTLDIRVERDVTDLGLLMRAALPKSAISISTFNDNVVLSGNVPNALEAKRATDLAAAFAGDPKKVVNMLSVAGGEQVMVRVRVAEMSRNIAKQFSVDVTGAVNVGGVPIIGGSSSPYGLIGRALSDASGARVGQVCPQAFVPNGSSSSTATTGFNTQQLFDITTGAVIPIPGTDPIQLLTGRVANDALTNTVTSTVPCASANNASGLLNALEQVGLVHMLAEPNATVVSGETHKFRAGGEFPVPTARDRDGNVTLEFKPFGVGLSFTPVVISPERISIQLSSEVSELSNTGAFTVAGSTTNVNGVSTTTPGATIPALGVRRTETTIELPSGGSMAIAGLLQKNVKQVIAGFPGAKDVPILGALARSRDFQNDETELVVVIEAYLVQPNAASAFSAPTDGFVVPSDPETILMGRLNAVYKRDDKPVEAKAAEAVGGFIVQ